MAFRIGQNASNSARKKSNDALVQSIDAGTTNTTGRLLIYTGTQPATPETTATGTLLVTINFATTSFAASSAAGSASLTGGTAISATVAATGTAGYFRITDRDNNPICDGSVGTSASDINFDSVSFVTGGTATISALTIATPM